MKARVDNRECLKAGSSPRSFEHFQWLTGIRHHGEGLAEQGALEFSSLAACDFLIMQFHRIDPIDPIEELRLRRWARENYVPQSSRLSDWHPIILQEMLSKDREDGRQDRLAGSGTGRGVLPVGPMSINGTSVNAGYRVVHAGHADMLSTATMKTAAVGQ